MSPWLRVTWLSKQSFVGVAELFIEEVKVIERFKIENVTEADLFLRDLLAKDQYRSMDVVIARARELILDDDLRMYFINKAKEILGVNA